MHDTMQEIIRWEGSDEPVNILTWMMQSYIKGQHKQRDKMGRVALTVNGKKKKNSQHQFSQAPLLLIFTNLVRPLYFFGKVADNNFHIDYALQ